MIFTSAEVEQLADQVLDLAENLEYWYLREVATFGKGAGGHATKYTNTHGQVLADARQKANQVTRILLFWREAGEELHTALTLYDALEAHMAQDACTPLAQNGLSHPATLAALVRIALKCGSNAASNKEDLCDDALAEALAVMGLDIEKPELITHVETCIITTLNGRVGLSSPLQWAGTIITRLGALVILSVPLNHDVQIPEFAVSSVHHWAWLVTEKVPATASHPPRVLGLTACALGLIAAGVLPSEGFRPHDMPLTEWQGSLLVRVGTGNAHPLLQVEQLAEAACCSEEELCDWVFAGVAAVQASLSGDMH